MPHRTVHYVFILCILALLPDHLLAGEFRSIVPIARTAASRAPRKKGTPLGESLAQVERLFVKEAEDAMRSGVVGLFANWNSRDIEGFLSPSFVDGSRLLDAFRSLAPKDASVRVLAVEGVRPLTTELFEAASGRSTTVRVRLSARVRTQLEFNDPFGGFQRLEGLNEYVFSIDFLLPLPGNETP